MIDPDFAAPSEWAHLYRAKAIQVVPACSFAEVKPGTAWKRPLFKSWTEFQEALVPDDKFNEWYGPHGQYVARLQMGTICGRASDGMFVIDLDTHKNTAAAAWWQGMLAVHNNNMDLETPEQRTGGGGLQKLFRAPPGWTPPTCKTPIGVDIRGQGGFAMLAPSMHESGRAYEWLDGLSPDEVEIAVAPDWLVEAIDALVLAHGGSATSGQTKSSGPKTASSFSSGTYDGFGHQTDGREGRMSTMIWAAILDWYRERYVRGLDEMPTEAESLAREQEKYALYAAQIGPKPDEDGIPLNRGPEAFHVKWRADMRKWHGKVQEEALKRPPPKGDRKPDFTDEFAKAEEQTKTTGQPDAEPILVGDLNGEPREREWLVPDWLPKGVVSSLSGDGGVGKTLIAQQLLYAVGLGRKWLGIPVPAARGLGVFCEDDEDELHRRHNAIKADLGHPIDNPFPNTWIWPRVGYDNLLVTFDRDNAPMASPFFMDVMRNVLDKRIEFLVLDTIADTFGGNEIIRAQVNFFIKTTCGAFIKRAKDAGFTLTVLLLSHPSQAGRNSGSGESGSTAWNNAVRARLYLIRPEDGLPEQRTLIRKKSNYSASGDDVKLDLLWADGVLGLASSNNAVAVKSVENQIIQMVGIAWDSGRPYHGKRGEGMRFLDGEMVKAMGDRIDRGVIIQALKNVKGKGEIQLMQTGKKRGWRLPE